MLALLLSLAAQDLDPPTPYDRVIEMEITAEDSVLIEGKGPTKVVEHEIEFEGTLHVWASSELDLSLRVDDANEWETLDADDDSGGGTTPYLALEVNEGTRLLVLVAAGSGASGSLTLHLMAAPETEATRTAAAKVLRRSSPPRTIRRRRRISEARRSPRSSKPGAPSGLWPPCV